MIFSDVLQCHSFEWKDSFYLKKGDPSQIKYIINSCNDLFYKYPVLIIVENILSTKLTKTSLLMIQWLCHILLLEFHFGIIVACKKDIMFLLLVLCHTLPGS